jgi:hypothetical protein
MIVWSSAARKSTRQRDGMTMTRLFFGSSSTSSSPSVSPPPFLPARRSLPFSFSLVGETGEAGTVAGGVAARLPGALSTSLSTGADGGSLGSGVSSSRAIVAAVATV